MPLIVLPGGLVARPEAYTINSTMPLTLYTPPTTAEVPRACRDDGPTLRVVYHLIVGIVGGFCR